MHCWTKSPQTNLRDGLGEMHSGEPHLGPNRDFRPWRKCWWDCQGGGRPHGWKRAGNRLAELFRADSGSGGLLDEPGRLALDSDSQMLRASKSRNPGRRFRPTSRCSTVSRRVRRGTLRIGRQGRHRGRRYQSVSRLTANATTEKSSPGCCSCTSFATCTNSPAPRSASIPAKAVHARSCWTASRPKPAPAW